MKRLHVHYHPDTDTVLEVGELAEDRGRFFFEFSRDFEEKGFAISPFHLPVAQGLRSFDKLPGVFDDALPDGWGLLLMDRFLRRKGVHPGSFSKLERLAWMGVHAMGALSFYPPSKEAVEIKESFELGKLAREAQEVFEGEAADVLPELLFAGGSPGGARPKVLIGIKGEVITSLSEPYGTGYVPWMVKFFSRNEPPDTGAVEEAYARMAESAGIEFPEHRLFKLKEGSFFGVKRFDREGSRRIHMHSLGNLIGADFRIPCLDYKDIMKVVRILTGSQAEVVKAYRLMVFNVFAHNRDDHAKNFAFLFTPETGWRLAPGFDLTFTIGPGGEHTTSLNGEGRNPGESQMLAVADTAGINNKSALSVINQVRQAVNDWRKIALECGVGQITIEQIIKKVDGSRKT